MKYTGTVYKLGDDVDTDAIIPARFLNTTDPEELGSHAFEDYAPDFRSAVRDSGIVVAGRNFGCGSSREHAPVAMKTAGTRIVIAESFARIFYRNAFNTGLAILESAEAAREIRPGDTLEVDDRTGVIADLTSNKTYRAKPIPPFMAELLADGGLIPHLKKEKKKQAP
jgi:3-isopropylmalate/(R)-2-methylmalate dehydratase small subunit